MAVAAGHHSHWSSRLGFIFAAVGSAVGLGNFWRFPYEAGENGGGAFVIVYLGCILFIAMPLVLAELSIGRRGGLNAVDAVKKVAKEEGRSAGWSVFGWSGMIAAFMILTFYSVIGGWVVAYVISAAQGNFATATPEAVTQQFDALLADAGQLTIYHAVFMALTGFIVSRGLQRGIEPAVRILMPALALMMFGLVIFAAIEGDFAAAVTFLFSADFSKITPEVVLAAVGQAFFSVGVGVAIMLTYGSYLNRDVKLPQSAVVISLADTGIAILAGLLIFPIVFQFNLEPGAGPGLVFVTLPVAFGQMPFGGIVSFVFFMLLLVAAITSSISMLEIFVAWVEENLDVSRLTAAISGASVAWVIGLGSVFSFNIWADWHPLGFIPLLEGKNWFDMFDYISSNILLPLGGMLIAIFAGWAMSKSTVLEETGMSDTLIFKLWYFLIRFAAPVAIGAVFLFNLT